MYQNKTNGSTKIHRSLNQEKSTSTATDEHSHININPPFQNSEGSIPNYSAWPQVDRQSTNSIDHNLPTQIASEISWTTHTPVQLQDMSENNTPTSKTVHFSAHCNSDSHFKLKIT